MFDPKNPFSEVEVALFTQGMAALNGLQVLLIRLAEREMIDRQDVDLITKGMGRAFTSPQARNNELVADLQRKNDEVFAAIVAKLDKN